MSKTGLSYYASKLSDHIGETPEGFLVCTDSVIARTGWQTYAVGELPGDALKELGIDTGNPNAKIEVYRSPEEVFDPATIASFEGKSVTDDHPPAEKFVEPGSVADYELGHVQNVRKGSEALESGEWPLVADIFVKREPLLSKVRNDSVRELSCGYDFTLAKDGDRVIQTASRGNHVAVVQTGRAGAEARIKDSAPAVEVRNAAGSGSTGVQKEKPKVSNILKHLLGLGLKAYATDADPEKLAEAAEAIKEKEKPPEPEKKAEDKRADDRRADDRRTDDTGDKRARFHALLDRLLKADDAPPAEDTGDADLQELAALFAQFMKEEEGEPQHQEGEGEGAGEGGGEGEELAAQDVGCFEDPNGYVHPIRGSKGYKESNAAHDATARDGFVEILPEKGAPAEKPVTARDVLEALRPTVARTNDNAVRRAFNTQMGRFTRSSKASDGSYSGFAGATRQRAADATPGVQAVDHKSLQAAYDSVYTGKPINKETK